MTSYFSVLKEKGLKITPRRSAIIDIFLKRKKHLTSEEVWKLLSKKFDKCGLPSVYRNLESLTDCGILTRVEMFDSKKHYAITSINCDDHRQQHSHPITCIECGRVEELDECVLPKVNKIKGFKILNHFVQFNGICEDCANS